MAVYGASLYGPAGRALPAFSEGAMWAFAAAVTITCHRHPGRPVWHLRLGTVVFAGFGAALNFAHGLTAYGPVAGVVMALVSVAGVTAHQLVTAGPRRDRADRDAARTARAIGRRERSARRAAVRRALVDLDADGTARLVFEPGAATLERHLGRVRLAVPAPVPDVPAPLPAVPVAVPAPVLPPASSQRPRGEGGEAVRRRRGRRKVPGIRRIRDALHVGQPKAKLVQTYLAELSGAAHGTPAPPSAPLQPAQTQPSGPRDARRDP